MGKLVLVVDDDSGIRDVLADALDLEGYEVILASNGREALARVDETTPALIVLDIMMPGMDGFAVAADLERRAMRPGVPILVLTADGRAAEKAARMGAEGYIQKPFAVSALLQEVARIVGQ